MERRLGFGLTARQDPDPGLDMCVVHALPASDAVQDWLAVAEAATLRP